MGYLDNAGLSYVWSKLKALLGTKVDKEAGKGLSQENYTTEEKEEVAEHEEAMGFLVGFGNLCTAEGTLIIANSTGLRSADVKVTSPDMVDKKDNELYLKLIDTLQQAIYSANAYTDNYPLATADNYGFMSATDKTRLDEIWAAWSTKQFLTISGVVANE